MSSKIKVDTIENVAGSGNVSLGSGHNLVVPGTLAITGASTLTGNTTVGGTLGVTGTATLSGNATIGTNSGDTRFSLNSANQYTMVLKNAGNIAGQIGGGGADDLRFSNAAGTTTMQIKSNVVTKPLTPFVRLQLTSHVSPNTTVSAPGNQVTGFTVRENVGSYWNSSNNNFTCPVAGVYSASVFYIKYPASGNAHVDLHKNGVRVNEIRWRAPEVSAGYHQAGGPASVTCAANDVLDWHYFGSAGVHDGNGSWEIMLSH